MFVFATKKGGVLSIDMFETKQTMGKSNLKTFFFHHFLRQKPVSK